jgi:hypothetical protein
MKNFDDVSFDDEVSEKMCPLFSQKCWGDKCAFAFRDGIIFKNKKDKFRCGCHALNYLRSID